VTVDWSECVGFNGFTNGELLQAAEAAGFEVLLTGDLLSNTSKI
jgi:hypothetical protein